MSQNSMAGANLVFPDCIICLTPLQSELVTPANCGHVFHEECFRNWRNKGKDDVCPLCKRDSSHIIKLIYDIKYCQEDNTIQEPQTLKQLLERNKFLKMKNETYEAEIKDLTAYNDKCQKTVEGFKEKVEENWKNMKRYKDEYLSTKSLLDEEKEKNSKNFEIIQKLRNENKNLQDFKNKFEMKNQIDEETQKIILNKDIDKMQDDFEKQFYKLLNDDDEKKGLHEYFYVLQQKIVKLTEENDELKKYKKSIIMREKNENNIYTQFIQLSGTNHKRNILEYNLGKGGINNNNKKANNIDDACINKVNGIINKNENDESKRQINTLILNKNNSNNKFKTDIKKLFNNPFKNKQLTFLKKNKDNV